MALEAGDADELAGADLDVDRLGLVVQADAGGADDGRAGRGLRGGAAHLGGCVLVAGHQRDELTRCRLAAAQRGDAAARAQDGDAVGDLLDLVHAVRDEQDARALGAQALEHAEQALARRDVERRGGLVEDQHLGVAHERPRDARRLAIAERKGVRGDVQPRDVDELAQRLAGARQALVLGDAALQEPVGPEPDVLEDGLLAGGEDLLEDRRDAGRVGRARRGEERDLLTADGDRPGVGAMHARQDLHERALPRAVLAHDRVHLPAAEVERAVAQRLGRPEGLRQPRDLEDDVDGRRDLAVGQRRGRRGLVRHVSHYLSPAMSISAVVLRREPTTLRLPAPMRPRRRGRAW